MSILLAPVVQNVTANGVAPVVQMDPIIEVSDFIGFVLWRMDELGGYPAQIDEEHVQTLLNTDRATAKKFIDLSTYSKLNYNIHSLVVQARNNELNVEEHLSRKRCNPTL